MRFITPILRPQGVRDRLIRLALLVVAAGIALTVAVHIGNPKLDAAEAADHAPSRFAPPPPSAPPDPPLPPGFPSMVVPPPMTTAATGEKQRVPTKYGLTYVAPTGDGWRPSSATVMGWSDETTNRTIVMYGSVTDYYNNYCTKKSGKALANIGVRGRNGIAIAEAALQEVHLADSIFSDRDAANDPKIEISGPFDLTVSNRPAVRYTAKITGLHKDQACDPSDVSFDVVATPAYSTAEVAVFMIHHVVGGQKSLSGTTVDSIIKSISKTE